MRQLRIGLQGQDVLEAQCALTALGLYADDIDGCFGPHLQAATKAFQQSHQLAPTGLIDSVTAAALGLEETMATACTIPEITPQSIVTLFPATPALNLEANLPHLLNALADLHLNDRNMVMVALATMAAEASTFLPVSEKVWAGNTTPGGEPFDRYTNILDNSGLKDAADFRGRGFIQITGRCNYLSYSKKLFGDSRLVDNPLLAHRQDIAAKIFAHYLSDREAKFRQYLANDDLNDARALVNGGAVGLARFSSVFTAGLKLQCIQQLPVK